MFPDVTSAVAQDSRVDRMNRADRTHLAARAVDRHSCEPRAHHHRPHLGGRFRQWLDAGYLR